MREPDDIAKLSDEEYREKLAAVMEKITPLIQGQHPEVIQAVAGRIMVAYLMGHASNDPEMDTTLRQRLFGKWCNALFQVMDEAEKTDAWMSDDWSE